MLNKNLSGFVKDLKTAHLVAIYNLVTPEAPVKKFADRATAEKRVLAIMRKDYDVFFSDHALDVATLGIELPAPEVPVVEAPVAPASKKGGKAAKEPKAPKEPKTPKPARAPKDPNAPKAEQKTPPHLNLRCETCQYYAKSTPAMLAIARLKCPVDGSILKTAEERGEGRGRL